MRKAIVYGLACIPMLVGVGLVIVGCDQDYPDYPWDVAVDTTPEVTTDPGYEVPPDLPPDPASDPVTDPGTDIGVDPGTDPGVDPGTDPGVDPGTDTSGCTYPSGPYAYTRIGDTVGPASWATAIQASGETFPSPTARFEDFHCDPGVDSIIIFLATQS